MEDALTVALPEELSEPVLLAVPVGVGESTLDQEGVPVGDGDGELATVKLAEPVPTAEVLPVFVALSHGDGVPDADTDCEGEMVALTVPLRE